MKTNETMKTNTKSEIPESLRAQMSRAGKARQAQMTASERQELGRKAWATRLARARASEAISPGMKSGE